jgi:hypothetical protein
MGFVVYDEIKTTDFYARVEVQPDRVTLIMDPHFMAPLFEIDKPDQNQVHFRVHDVKGKTRGETIVVGEKVMWEKDEVIIFRMLNNRSAPKTCRMIITSAWEHREAVQATLPKWD